ncbi:MAG: LapA family protein [Syntrophales bacterium]|jgi:uncharacterized integral membrane protein|nr:LapA family protein [Syntrophales bacterium]
MKVIYTIVIVLLMMMIVTFSLENTAAVPLKYYDLIPKEFSVPAYMLLFVAFLAGVIFTGFMGIVERFRLTRTITRLNRTIRDLRRQIHEERPAELVEEEEKPRSLP